MHSHPASACIQSLDAHPDLKNVSALAVTDDRPKVLTKALSPSLRAAPLGTQL